MFYTDFCFTDNYEKKKNDGQELIQVHTFISFNVNTCLWVCKKEIITLFEHIIRIIKELHVFNTHKSIISYHK